MEKCEYRNKRMSNSDMVCYVLMELAKDADHPDRIVRVSAYMVIPGLIGVACLPVSSFFVFLILLCLAWITVLSTLFSWLF